MKIGILGAGKIASIMSRTISQMENATCYAVAARDQERAEKFAETYGFEKAISLSKFLRTFLISSCYCITSSILHLAYCLCHNRGNFSCT